MRIGELARRSGVGVRLLRYYEEQGLLEADRAPGRPREYPEGAVGSVQLIRRLYDAGLTGKAVAELLPCATTGAVTQGKLDRLLAERDSIAVRINELTRAKAALDGVIGRVQSGGLLRDGGSAAGALPDR
ncbi:MerR family transcriptional regulator [Streptomyces sp. NPDC046853]|uniref:MerR family transcriptional regulator n=1 Tax=unclassified Streptomyces TaxID=2593676 RepID=UPI0034043B7B